MKILIVDTLGVRCDTAVEFSILSHATLVNKNLFVYQYYYYDHNKLAGSSVCRLTEANLAAAPRQSYSNRDEAHYLQTCVSLR